MPTKSTKLIYWITTALFAGFMIFSAIPNIPGLSRIFYSFHWYCEIVGINCDTNAFLEKDQRMGLCRIVL
jgi:hypothetical protein